MRLARPSLVTRLRALLALGRVSNLPTVWSNCLAGWWLGGGGHLGRFLLLGAGATGVYLGGMFLNDACDEPFDAIYRRERPIPAGLIPLRTVWWWGLGWLGLGALFLAWLGKGAGFLGLLLIGSVLLYDFVHKLVTFSPVLMAFCRFLLYLIAASVAADGITGLTVWSGLVLAAYILGLSYLARKESAPGPLCSWPAWLLGLPIVLALLVDDGPYRTGGVLLSLVLLVWLVRSLRHTFWTPARNVAYTVSSLLAGIVLVDLLAAADAPMPLVLVFILLFVAALLGQRFVPAT